MEILIKQALDSISMMKRLEELASGGYRWRLKDIDLHEISVVTFPAYENTSVQARSKQIEQLEQRKLQQKKMN